MRGGSDDVILTGHTFSDEPGIYIEGEVNITYLSKLANVADKCSSLQIGVRLEDCFYIDENGNAVYLTEGVGGQSQSPWLP